MSGFIFIECCNMTENYQGQFWFYSIDLTQSISTFLTATDTLASIGLPSHGAPPHLIHSLNTKRSMRLCLSLKQFKIQNINLTMRGAFYLSALLPWNFINMLCQSFCAFSNIWITKFQKWLFLLWISFTMEITWSIFGPTFWFLGRPRWAVSLCAFL